jgi:hypothetical protein
MGAAMSNGRVYHVVVVNEKTGLEVVMTESPVSHKEGCAILSKMTIYPFRRNQLREVRL